MTEVGNVAGAESTSDSATSEKHLKAQSIAAEKQPCRTCFKFSEWMKLQRQQMLNKTKDEKRLGNTAGSDDDEEDKNLASTNQEMEIKHPENCPLDKDQLGRATWGLLHSIAARYPRENPSEAQSQDVSNFLQILSRIYPCDYCARDLREDLEKYPVDASGAENLAQYVCRMHNRVNEKLGRPLFDCSRKPPPS